MNIAIQSETERRKSEPCWVERVVDDMVCCGFALQRLRRLESVQSTLKTIGTSRADAVKRRSPIAMVGVDLMLIGLLEGRYATSITCMATGMSAYTRRSGREETSCNNVGDLQGFTEAHLRVIDTRSCMSFSQMYVTKRMSRRKSVRSEKKSWPPLIQPPESQNAQARPKPKA